MKGDFFKVLFTLGDLTESESNIIDSALEFKYIPSKTKIVQYNKKNNELFFILKGCIRKYCIKDGEDITLFITTEGQFAVEYVSFITGDYSQNVLETVEDSEVLILKKPDLDMFYTSIPKMNEVMRKILEKVLLDSQTMVNEFIMFNPEERYINLLNNKPHLLERIPQYIIASYLGISATSLSRIRKRIITK